MNDEGSGGAPRSAARMRRRGDHRVLAACSVAACLAGILFFWMLTAGTMDPSRRVVIDAPIVKFNEAQAHAIVAGHFDVPVDALGGEAIYPDAPVGKFRGKTYGYYGPTPALLRIPVLAFTDEKYPYLAPYFFMAGFAFEACALVALLLFVRKRVPVPVGPRWEPFAYGALVFAVLGGSIFLFLASRPVVYEEAILWGNACALAAFYAILRFITRPGWAWLMAAGVFTTLSILARVSLGIGPVLALGIIGLLAVVARIQRPATTNGGLGGFVPNLPVGLAIGVLACAVIPVALLCAVNYAKFGTLFSIPLDHQWFIGGNPGRRQLVESLGGEFAPKYVPVNAWFYSRPDALVFTSSFPWVDFPKAIYATQHLPVLGTVVYDGAAGTASLTTMMPALAVLAVIGTWKIARPQRDGARLALLRIPLFAAIASTVGALALFGQQPRYLADFLPWLIIAGVVGVAFTLTWRPKHRGVKPVATVVLLVLAVFGAYVSFALTLVNQRVISVEIKPSLKEQYVKWQQDLPHG